MVSVAVYVLGNNVRGEVAKALAEVWKSRSNSRDVNLSCEWCCTGAWACESSCDVCVVGMMCVAAAAVCLVDHNVGDAGATALAEAWKRCPELRDVNLASE